MFEEEDGERERGEKKRVKWVGPSSFLRDKKCMEPFKVKNWERAHTFKVK